MLCWKHAFRFASFGLRPMQQNGVREGSLLAHSDTAFANLKCNMPPAEGNPLNVQMKQRPELRVCVCGFAFFFIGYMCCQHNELYSTSTLVQRLSGAFGSRDLVIEENWDRNGKCLDSFDLSFQLTVAFSLESGLINERVGLLHGFTVAYFLGAENVVEPQVSTSLEALDHYDTVILRNVLNELNLTLLPERPHVKTLHFDKLRDIQGEPVQWICSQIREGLIKEATNHIMVDLGVPGLLRADERNLGLIAFIDKRLEYNNKIRVAAQSILGKLPPIFNGLHLPASDEAYKTSSIVIPENIVPKMMQLGFQQETTVFVASGVLALDWNDCTKRGHVNAVVLSVFGCTCAQVLTCMGASLTLPGFQFMSISIETREVPYAKNASNTSIMRMVEQ